MKVLIIKMSALGDIIHALPVLDYLHKVYPGIEIDWVVEDSFLDIVAGNPLISQIHVVRKKKWRKTPLAKETWRETGALSKALRERSYDMVFDIQGNIKSGVVSFLSRTNTRYGFTGEVIQERLNLLFNTVHIPIHLQDQHVTDQYLRLVSAPFDIDFNGMELRSDIYTSPADDTAAEALVASLNCFPLFLFHYGTTWQTKFWTEARWIELGMKVIIRYPGCSILFSWGNDEEFLVVSRLAAAIGPGAKVIERYALKGLTALLKKVAVVVGGDTGPVHLAAAVGTPTVSFYRASNGKRSGPRGDWHVIIQAPLDCTACFQTKCDKDAMCRDSITVQAVISGIEKLLPTSTGHKQAGLADTGKQ